MKFKLENLFKTGKTAVVAGMVVAAAREGIAATPGGEKPLVEASDAIRMTSTYERPAATSIPGSETKTGRTTKKKEATSGPNPEIEEGEPVTLNISAYFKTATVEFIDASARERAKNDIRAFLKTVDLKTSKVKVLGTYSTRRAWQNNDKIALDRKELGIQILREVLLEQYTEDEIAQMNIESEARGQNVEELYTQEQINNMTPEELERAIDETQGIRFFAEAKPPSRIVTPEVSTIVSANIQDFGFLVIDESQSMANDIQEVKEEVGRIKKEQSKTIKLLTLEGGNEEAHLRTLRNFLTNLKTNTPLKILILTDEPDNTMMRKVYEQNIGEVLGLAKNKNVEITVKVFNPNKAEGGFKVFLLNKNRFGLSAYQADGSAMLTPQQWYNQL